MSAEVLPAAEARTALFAALQDTDVSVRQAAAGRVKECAREGDLPALRERAQEESDPDAKAELEKVIGKLEAKPKTKAQPVKRSN